ncbi:hypothetical protein CAOG_01366 [Capsaspora owczarzaki ATCC 30864]|uniref:hypothetical protein n=1 Tax=Capsaspora owczarzaki (strain ATCC 30864) TaxID=595528 RepID=UPI0001FE2DFC|nr:hypothetical protein CAOG_01366 [Capsaspora owczarzaki ATCC 30864]|eukprot:XP_004349886.1 hypothetical protein CAOG_01366 [Capsaspora owczarzaki ATCC 30864]
MATIEPHDEIINGEEAKVLKWIESYSNGNVDILDVHNFTLLHWAVRKHRVATVAALIAKKANVNAVNEIGDTPLHYAIAEGHLDVVQMLLACQPNVNVPNKHGNTPLHYATFWRFNDLAVLLVERGALVAQSNKYGETPLTRAGKQLGDAMKSLAMSAGQTLDPIPFKVTKVVVSTSKQVLSALGPAKFEFDWRLLEQPSSLGQGHLGEVARVRWNTKHELVLKTFHDQNVTKLQLNDFFAEAQVLRGLNHENLLPLLGYVAFAPHLGLVSEFLPDGSLYKQVHDTSKSIDTQTQVQWALGIANALNYLHGLTPPGMPYFDLTSHSIFIDKENVARVNVADSEFRRTFEKRLQLFKPHWIAPEVLKAESTDRKKADMYSFAIVMYEIFARRLVYDNMNAMQIGMKVALEQLRPVIPESVPRHFQQLISICWQESPEKRPAFDQVIPILQRCL